MTGKDKKRHSAEPKHKTVERTNTAPDSPSKGTTHDTPAPHYDQQERTPSTNTEVETAKSGNNDSFQTDSRPK
ncbi:hypothetical protein BH10BDE1_BH10BDE1_28210 [soil metagenome]